MKSEVKREKRTVEYEKRKVLKTFISTVLILAFLFFCSLSISVYVFPLARVYDDSMTPDLKKNTIVLINKSCRIGRGDLVAFSVSDKLLVKRCIAVSGDVVDIDSDGSIYLNGILLDEKYVSNKQYGTVSTDFPCTVPDGCIFVLSDNRENYSDSRNKLIGSVCEDEILGKVVFKLFPFNETSIVK